MILHTRGGSGPDAFSAMCAVTWGSPNTCLSTKPWRSHVNSCIKFPSVHVNLRWLAAIFNHVYAPYSKIPTVKVLHYELRYIIVAYHKQQTFPQKTYSPCFFNISDYHLSLHKKFGKTLPEGNNRLLQHLSSKTGTVESWPRASTAIQPNAVVCLLKLWIHLVSIHPKTDQPCLGRRKSSTRLQSFLYMWLKITVVFGPMCASTLKFTIRIEYSRFERSVHLPPFEVRISIQRWWRFLDILSPPNCRPNSVRSSVRFRRGHVVLK